MITDHSLLVYIPPDGIIVDSEIHLVAPGVLIFVSVYPGKDVRHQQASTIDRTD